MIPVIDLFAGPGGLGEGFSSVIDDNERFFKIALSIEKEKNAHQTLLLRSFFRQFPVGDVPEDYYKFLRGEIKKVDELYNSFPYQYEKAKEEACRFILGDPKDQIVIRSLITKVLNGDNQWVLIGGPPCQAYSLAGRSRVGGIDPEDHRVTLYKEYLRIIAEFHPAVFVMENVKGLLSADLEGKSILRMMLEDLSQPDTVFKGFNSPQYKIYSLAHWPDDLGLFQPIYKKNKQFVIRSENYGIPQKRHRIILLGIIEDLNIASNILKEVKKVSLKSVIDDLPRLRSGLSKTADGNYEWIRAIKDFGRNGFLEELRRNADDKIIKKVESYINKVRSIKMGRGDNFVKTNGKMNNKELRDWYIDPRMGGVCNHITRGHMIKDLERYFFMSSFARATKESVRLKNFPKAFLPNHRSANSGDFQDRFRVQLPTEPANTVTSHISQDGHYFIHYDPTQCRSFTVREAARIQTFPDNYYFMGSMTQQYKQVGNAVPVLLANKIAKIVKEIIENANLV